jgi:steroid 5-alpha reductase family enzyme
MDKWVQRFGALFIVSAILWVVFNTAGQWGAVDGTSPSPDLLRAVTLTWALALASFAGTTVTVLMQWSIRLGRSDLSRHWHDPDDTP